MKKLVFVYNGDSGLFNGVMHYLHKRISPETYPCQLCGIIYDGVSVKQEWLTFIKTLNVQTEFLHRDEYRKQYGNMTMPWPAVLLHEGTTFKEVVLSADDFSAIHDMTMLQRRLQKFSETSEV